MRILLTITLMSTIWLSGCGSITKMVQQSDGTYKKIVVASVTSFGRDIISDNKADITFAKPLTQEGIDNYKGWLKPYLMPGMTRINVSEHLSSESNVQGTVGAVTEMIKTGAETAAKAM